MEKHYTLLKAADLLGVTTQTLRNWDKTGKIRAIRTPGNQRRIPESEIARLCGYADYDNTTNDIKPQRITQGTDDIAIKQHYDMNITPETAPETAIETGDTAIATDEASTLPSVIVPSADNYILMCKDSAVYDISNELVLNENLLPGCMLKNKLSYHEWMETRYSRDTNFSSERLMHRAFGVYDHEHAKHATGALSLSDCYWLKRREDDILFADVTPYINKEWDGLDANGIQNDYIWGSLSNLFVSGKTDKRWLDASTLLKIDSFREAEPYLLCSLLGLGNVTETQKSDDGLLLSNFTSSDIFFESMEQSSIEGDEQDLRHTAVERSKELAVALFTVDYLIENNDRFSDDYGYLRDANTGDYISMAPYFNFDWAWSGESIALPNNALQDYRNYIHDLCLRAINVSTDFSYATIIEKRATELLHL